MEKDKLRRTNSKDIVGQKMTETTPKVSGENFENIFHAARDGMIIIDSETRKYVMWNTACCNMLGYTPEEFSNLDTYDIYPQDELPFIFEQIEEFYKGNENIRSDTRFKRKDGSVIITDLNPSTITLNQKNFILLSFRDITERKQAEKELSRKEEQLRTLLENASDGIFIIGRKGKYISVNKKGCDMLGYTSEEIQDMNILDNMNLDPNQASVWLKELQERKSFLYEKSAIRKDGSIIQVEISVKLLQDGRALGIVRDITERKKIEKKLKIYEKIMESAIDAISAKDLEERYIFVNKTFAKQHNLPQEEIIGKTVFDLYPADIANEITEESKKVTKMNQTNITEHRSASKSEQVILQNVMMPLYDESNKTIGTFSISRDITELKNLEAEIRNLSYLDPLTGLYNRRYFDEELDRLQNSRHYPITIFSLDLDGLKTVNDTLGHEAGDKYIQKAANTISNSFPRAEDFKCRMGGDEFTIVISEANQTIIQKLTKKLKFNSKNAQIAISIGIATAHDWKKSLRDTLREADDKMYADKKARKAILNSTVQAD